MAAVGLNEGASNMKQNICKICRRLSQKLFLKGDKCLSPKCPFIKRPYPPGPRKKRRRFSFSEYAKELTEKQKLQKYYGLSEKQFRKYVQNVLEKRGKVEDSPLLLIKTLEKRLDNVVFRMGFARSRREARELVSHGHFLVEGKPVNIPAFQTKKGMTIVLKKSKQKKPFFKDLLLTLKNYQAPSWLKIDVKKLEGKIASEPTLEDAGTAVDISAIFEFYSR